MKTSYLLSSSKREEAGHNLIRSKEEQKSNTVKPQCLTWLTHDLLGFRCHPVSAALPSTVGMCRYTCSRLRLAPHQSSCCSCGYPMVLASLTHCVVTSGVSWHLLSKASASLPVYSNVTLFMPPKPVVCDRLLNIATFGFQVEMQLCPTLDHSFYVLILRKYSPQNFETMTWVSF